MNKYTDEDTVEDGDYRESEDEDYDPETHKNVSDSDSEDEEERKLAANYKQIQGNGGLIKSRARKIRDVNNRTEENPTATVGKPSVDVDALWAEMNSGSGKDSKASEEGNVNKIEETVTIKRTFKFAGEIKTETKEVPLLSSEGQDYIKELALKQKDEGRKKLLKGPTREPVKRKLSLMEEYKMNKAKKINTLEKSRLDWLGFVDKEGIKDDLTKHNKDGYLDRQSFLERVDQNRENELRQQRAKKL